MTIQIDPTSSSVQITLQASPGLPADFHIFNEDGANASVSIPAFTPGQTSIVITINRLIAGAGAAKLHALGTDFPDTPLFVSIAARPNAFTWREDTVVQVP